MRCCVCGGRLRAGWRRLDRSTACIRWACWRCAHFVDGEPFELRSQSHGNYWSIPRRVWA